MRSTSLLSSIAALSLGSGLVSATCNVYGIDFVSGGTYFQNISSTSPFTAVQEFSGCNNDTANNILVDPNGDQTQCSDTAMTPDYTDETITCDGVDKDQMFTGEWSIIIISNNGDGDPIAYERDFSLNVGTPSTTTFTPTVTATEVETSISSIYTTTTSTITTTLVAQTVTKQALIALPKPTLTSKPVQIQKVTKNLSTVTQTKYVPHVTQKVVQATANCVAPSPNWVADPIAKIEVTVIKSVAQALSGSAKFRRALANKETMDAAMKRDFIADRSARLANANALDKRAPDVSVVTVTATTSLMTSTVTQYTTITTTFPTTSLVTSTVTPAKVTVTKALLDFSSLQTKVADAFVFKLTEWDIATVVQTQSVPWTVTVTSTSTPAGAAAKCAATGGKIA